MNYGDKIDSITASELSDLIDLYKNHEGPFKP